MLTIPGKTKPLSVTKIKAKFCHARFHGRKHCLQCGYRSLYALNDGRYKCRRCAHRFSLWQGTYLDQVRIDLPTWYAVLWAFVLELTAMKASQGLSLRYETTLKAYQSLRAALAAHSFLAEEKFGQRPVELDESFFGGKFKNKPKWKRQLLRKLGLVKRGRGAKNLYQPAFGILERNGRVYVEPIDDFTRQTLEAHIQQRIERGATVYSDTFRSYQLLLVEGGYDHDTISHQEEEYVRGKVHINGIEGFWGLSKVWLAKYFGVKEVNWRLYLKECEFRYNTRELALDQKVDFLIQLLTKLVR